VLGNIPKTKIETLSMNKKILHRFCMQICEEGNKKQLLNSMDTTSIEDK